MRSLTNSALTNLGLELSRLDLAWQDYVSRGHPDPRVRPVILDSWERCAQCSVDAFSNKTSRLISTGEARDRRDNDPLFTDLRMVESSLLEAALESEHLLVFCDGNGTILQIGGEAAIRKRAESMNFVVGSAWSEAKAGTNAIGTAIATRTPIRVLGAEHFCSVVHPWTCSAAPIHDPATGKVLAIIDLTGPREVFHPHTMAVVVTATRLIEEQLRSRFEGERFRLLEQYVSLVTQFPSRAVAVLDRGWRIVKASTQLYEDGWIDRDDRLVGCPLTNQLSLQDELSWEAERPKGRSVFVARTFISDHKPIGFIVEVTTPAKSLQQHQQAAKWVRGVPETRDPRACALYSFGTIIGNSRAFRIAVSAAQSAGDHFPVIIEGETGTGKELMAQAIHTASNRSRGPFIAVNCAAIPKELAASELFGFEGGTFTSAAREGRLGKFEQANRGTIFLDEIADMPLELQTLLLRVLEEREVVHLGGSKPIPIDVRVIVATNQNLMLAVDNGQFRKDLYYRLNVIRIHIPPLRDRIEDLPLLLEHYLDRAYRNTSRHRPRLDRSTLDVLQNYHWPGNVRELRNLVDKIYASQTGDTVWPDDLPHEFISKTSNVQQQPFRIESSQNQGRGILKKVEIETIRSTLEACGGNVSDAANKLGINRSTIYRKLGRNPELK